MLNELAKDQPKTTVLFVCDTAFEVQARGLMQGSVLPVRVQTITAGKLRRYSHLTTLRQLLMPRLVVANMRDMFKVAIGTIQSVALILSFKPDVVFAKGGYVCLPIGIAARLLRIPMVVHDSDARPGLTNRILGRWAAAIATGSPLENYRYPAAISRYVGVPIAAEFHPYDLTEQEQAKRKLGFSSGLPLVVVTGGGLGAASINVAMLGAARELLAHDVQIYHVTGRAHYDEVSMLAAKDNRYQLVPFVYEGMASVLGAADVVVSRASATFIQELAGLKKTAILVPSRALGDQRKNAEVYREAEAAVVLTDADVEEAGTLTEMILRLLSDSGRRAQLAERLHHFARPHAARDVAQLILHVVHQAKRPNH